MNRLLNALRRFSKPKKKGHFCKADKGCDNFHVIDNGHTDTGLGCKFLLLLPKYVITVGEGFVNWQTILEGKG